MTILKGLEGVLPFRLSLFDEMKQRDELVIINIRVFLTLNESEY